MICRDVVEAARYWHQHRIRTLLGMHKDDDDDDDFVNEYDCGSENSALVLL